MPARKSAPKPSKPKTKPKAAPRGPSEGLDKPAGRKAKAPPAKKAPAKKAAPARKPRGAAASKASAQPAPKPKAKPATPPPAPSVAAQLLARKGALDAPHRDKPLTPLDEAFLTEYMRNGMNGTAAWRFIHPGVNPVAAASAAYAALRKPQMAARVESERKRMAKRHELTRDQLLAEFLAIARADPNELVQMRAVACKSCWGGTVAGQSQWTEPDPECADCMGDGNAVPWIADTRKLSPEARALYAGIQQTKEGIKVLMHDKVAALTAAGRIIGAFEKDNEQKTKGTAEALREFFGALHGANHAGLPIVAPGDLPSQRNPLVKG
jgi:phage terminase small subunit